MGINKYNQLLKNSDFLYKYQIMIDEILENFNSYNTNEDYKRGVNEFSEKKLTGILILYRGLWTWSWMNTINTNYSCLEILVKSVNKLAKRDGKKTNNYFKFNGNDEENLLELEKFKIALNYYRDELFIPNKDKDSPFNQMRFITQYTWYLGLISQIYLLENINCFFSGNCIFKLDYNRGNDEDMKKGIDVKINIDGITKTLQHKKDTLSNSDDTYDYFNSVIYKEKLYRVLDLFSIGDYKNNKIYVYKNSTNWLDCGMIGSYPKKNFRIKKELKIEQLMNTELKNKLSLCLDELLKFCCNNHINFHMSVESDVIGNKIEYSEDIEPNVHIIYNDIHDEEFSTEVTKMLVYLKNKTT